MPPEPTHENHLDEAETESAANPADALSDMPEPGGELQRFRMTVAYDGTAFFGWQKQLPPDRAPLRTVQGVLEEVVARTVWRRIHLFGASRTDSGVHARGQVAQFDADVTMPVDRMALAFNSRLPDDVEVRDVTPAPAHFDCIRSAVNKQYRYRIFNSARRPLDRRNIVYHCFDKPLDIERMRDAADRLVGRHDVVGFAQAKHGRLTTERTIAHCAIELHEPEVHIVVQGDGFLYNQVRIMAGTLVAVGRARMEPARINEILEKKDRRLAGPTLPASGLCLEWIQYPGEPIPVDEVRFG